MGPDRGAAAAGGAHTARAALPSPPGGWFCGSRGCRPGKPHVAPGAGGTRDADGPELAPGSTADTCLAAPCRPQTSRLRRLGEGAGVKSPRTKAPGGALTPACTFHPRPGGSGVPAEKRASEARAPARHPAAAGVMSPCGHQGADVPFAAEPAFPRCPPASRCTGVPGPAPHTRASDHLTVAWAGPALLRPGRKPPAGWELPGSTRQVGAALRPLRHL